MISDIERKETGRIAEEEAVRLIMRKGMKILERNWRGGRQEIDIVAKDGDTIVFVEVRARRAGAMVSAIESISHSKQFSMIKGAKMYLTSHNAWHNPCRFDVVAATVTRESNGKRHFELEHLINVLQL